jgi:hypothetical protein
MAKSVGETIEKEATDIQLFILVGSILVVFYLIIMWVITSADKDRIAQLKKIN